MSKKLTATFGKPDLTVALIRRFPAQDVMRHLGPIQDKFSPYLPNFNVLPSNAQTPPENPRFALSGTKKSLTVAGTMINLTLDFSAGAPASGMRPPIMKAIAEMAKLDAVLNDQKKFYSGVIIGMTYKGSATLLEAHSREILERIMEHPGKDLKFGNFAIVREDSRFLSSFEMSRVKQYEHVVVPGQPSHISIDLDFDSNKLLDGLQFKLDVNNKPLGMVEEPNPFAGLFDKVCEMSSIEGQAYIGEDLVEELA